jgi:hypothetical protein
MESAFYARLRRRLILREKRDKSASILTILQCEESFLLYSTK